MRLNKEINKKSIIRKTVVFLFISALLFAAGCGNPISTPLGEEKGVPDAEIRSFLESHLRQYAGDYLDYEYQAKHSVSKTIDKGTTYIVDYLDLNLSIEKEKGLFRMKSSNIFMKNIKDFGWSCERYHFDGLELLATPTPSPTPIPTPSPSPTPEPVSPIKKDGISVFSASDLSKNDVVTFGSYPQTVYSEFKPIEWYVLYKDNNKVTLLSVCVLDSRPYHRFNDSVDEFYRSDIRRWLDSVFAEIAFTEEERAMILPNIGLLSKDKAESLDESVLRCKATYYAILNGFDPEINAWWLSDPVKNEDHEKHGGEPLSNYALFVHFNEIGEGYPFDMKGIGVRPVITIQF